MAKIISIINHKGGVGKTTSVASLGVALSRLGKRVLVVDLDAQGNLTDILTQSPGSRTIYDALRDQRDLPVVTIREGLDLCPSSIDLSGMDIELADIEGREYKLANLLKGLQYDVILLDCPPSIGLLTINALCASDEVYIPIIPEALPVRGLGSQIDIIERVREDRNPRLRLGGVIITRYNRRKINRLVEETLRDNLKELVFKTRIRENVDISESPLQGMDIFSYSPNSIGAKDYEDLAKEVIEKL